jgi:hypothetical protein
MMIRKPKRPSSDAARGLLNGMGGVQAMQLLMVPNPLQFVGQVTRKLSGGLQQVNCMMDSVLDVAKMTRIMSNSFFRYCAVISD